MRSRSPAEVSFYLGLATAIATFSAASVALGLLQCRRGRDRAVSVAVTFCATVGITTALVTVARGHNGGVGNILIAAGVLATSAFVLSRAMRLIFTRFKSPGEGAAWTSAHNSSTHKLPVIWTAPWIALNDAGSSSSGNRQTTILHVPLRVTSGAFILVVFLATAAATPDGRGLLNEFLRSRPVGQSAAGRETRQAALTILSLVNYERAKRRIPPLHVPNH
jgi:hypothetical protein